jgi:hypothetical protein
MTTLPTGFYPFWFWNDTITSEEIFWQVAQMAAQGIRGFFIHCRQGLKDPPYLSEMFLDRVGDAITAARQYGLVVHLYDEYPYPSGIAGGTVVLGEPGFMATELVQQAFTFEGGPLRQALPPGKVLSLLAFPLSGGEVDWEKPVDLADAVGPVLDEDSYQLSGLTRYNRKRYFANQPTPTLQAVLPPGQWRVVASLQRVQEHFKYWNNFTDVLNPQAVRRFINQTHEKYYRRFASEFGHTIQWIFTDEVIPGWSTTLPEAFQQAYGYDLLPLLPALQDPAHPRHIQVSADLHRLKLALFSRTFEEQVGGWCREHGIAYAAEKPSLRFSQLQYQDIPGCEPGHVKAGAVLDLLQPTLRGNAKATASAAYFYGKAGALDECYHSLGWSGTLEDIRWMADAQLLLGIRYLVPHGFFYSTHNLRKHDAPPSFFYQSPFWPLFHRLSERVDRIGKAFEGSYIHAQMAVVDPTAGLPAPSDRADLERLWHTLMGAHLDFHVVDTDILSAGRMEAGKVILRDVAIQLVLVPPMPYIEPALSGWLEAFQKAGGQVVYCPERFNAEELVAELRQVIRPSLSLCTGGVENPALWSVQRRQGEQALWFVLNISGQAQTVDLEAGRGLREIPLQDDISPRLQTNAGRVQRLIQPFEACLLEAVPETRAGALPEPISIPLSGQMAVRPLSPNLARLYDWQLSLLDEHGAAEQTAPVQAVPLANQLESGGLRFAPVIERAFGTSPNLRWPELHLRYTCTFECSYAGPVELVMEPGSIAGEWSLRINDSTPFSRADFHPSAAHVRGSLGLAIAHHLREGGNIITVDVTTNLPGGGLLNPLYLAGEFGLSLNPLCLTQRFETGRFEDYPANGLPYYAGTLEYRLSFDIPGLPDEPEVMLQLAPLAPFHEACQVSVNADPWHDLPWAPYRVSIQRAALHPGANELVIRVFTTLIRSFEGQEFDYQAHKYISIGD